MTNIAAMESPRSRYTMRHVVRAELTKLTSLRSTIWMLLVTFAGSVVVTILSTNSVTHHDPAWYQGFDPTNQAMGGLVLAVLTVGILGALAATGEYGSGTIRASLAATPRRRLFLAGKAVVVGGIVLVVGEALTFVCFGVGQAILGSGGRRPLRAASPASCRRSCSRGPSSPCSLSWDSVSGCSCVTRRGRSPPTSPSHS